MSVKSLGILAAVIAILAVSGAPTQAEETRLLRMPSIGERHVVFVYANDVWVAGRDGGDARRLTTADGAETNPRLSPDGKLVAFSGQYDGNTDVYVVPVEGGEPRRLTWHPGPDIVRGFTPDGAQVLFASGRDAAPQGFLRLWTVALAGGMPQALPIGRASTGSYARDAKWLAYQLVAPWEEEFRNYRGGQAQPIRILDIASGAVTKLPWEGSDDREPVWLDGTIYFLSDRDFAMNVWSFDVATGAVAQRTFFKEFDCKSLAGGAGRLVFENGGWLYTLDAAGGEPKKLAITVRGDFPWARPHWEDVAELVESMDLSPSGKRAIFEARGEIFTVPAKKGDVRALTTNSRAADRAPAWSPDGETIAWFSDASGEYRLILADVYGRVKREHVIPDPTFFYTPRWSPDGKHIAFGDADRNLRLIDVASGSTKTIDNEGFAHPVRILDPAWSPDSRYVAYAKRLKSEYGAIFVYSLEDGKTRQITDGLADCFAPAWDKSGLYLYFLASVDYGLNVGWLDMSSIPTRINRSLYAAVLSRETPSPLLPESDEEGIKDGKDGKDEKGEKTEKKDDGEKGTKGKKGDAKDKSDDAKEKEKEKEKAPAPVKIDFEDLAQRIIALPMPPRNYQALRAAGEKSLVFGEALENQPGMTVQRFSFEDRETKPVIAGVLAFDVSADGKKLLYAAPSNAFGIVDVSATSKPGEGKLATEEMRAYVDPPAEWAQIFREAIRYQRDYFYVENVHGLDLGWAERTYGAWLPHVRHRSDLTRLLDIVGGETSVGHSFTGGGDVPDVDEVPVGLLGADVVADGERYRIAKIYDGESWNASLKAPLRGPGIDVREGDYVIAVDDVDVTTANNFYAAFERTANRETRLLVNAKPVREGAREVKVHPVANEMGLRRYAWIEENRRRVDELSGGKLAYVWLPDTGDGGFSNFNRYYFAQKDKQGAVIDERFNQGGSIADYIVDLLARELLGYFNNPLGDKQPWTAPNAALWGPKVMIINEMAGSGGDMLPYMFAKRGVGLLVGTRTWGGLVGIWDVPAFIDGGGMTAPRGGFYDTDGRWAVENEGVSPDVAVEEDPRLFREGRDAQLEAAVELLLRQLDTEGITLLPQPPDPVRVKRPL